LKLEHIGTGGLSGTPLRKKSNEFIRFISEKTNNRLPVIGSGGIRCIEDANEKILLGSDLIQIWTGFIYEGPGLVRKILKAESLRPKIY
jgi:dihydroorotate dehydrogenase